MVQVIKINWLSEEAREAEVVLFDGHFELTAFSQPFNQDVGNNIELPVYTLNAREIFSLKGEEEDAIEKKINSYEHKFTGRVIDKDMSQIKSGKFIIQLDMPLPNDIIIGDYVTFLCDRVDIY